MKYLLVSLLFLAVLIGGFFYLPYFQPTDVKNLVYREGLYYKQFSNSKFTGSIESYFDNGQLKNLGKIKNGKRQGLWKSYEKKGYLQSEGNY